MYVSHRPESYPRRSMVAKAWETESCWNPFTSPMASSFFFCCFEESGKHRSARPARPAKRNRSGRILRKILSDRAASGLLHPPEREEIRFQVLIPQLSPVVVHGNQFSADVIRLVGGQKQGKLNLLLGRNPPGPPDLRGGFNLAFARPVPGV